MDIEVDKLLTERRDLPPRFISHLHKKAQTKLINKVACKVFKDTCFFAADEAWKWLPPVFEEEKLQWNHEYSPLVLEYLWKNNYIDLREHDPDMEYVSYSSSLNLLTLFFFFF